MVNYFIVDELDSWPRNFDTDFTLGGCLFGEVKPTKNADLDKYSHSGYSIGFDTCGEMETEICMILVLILMLLILVILLISINT